MTTPTVETLRETVEAYSSAADLEFYRHFSGQKEKLEMAALVERFGEAFTPDAVRAVMTAAGNAADDAERRRHIALAQAVASMCMERELAAPGDELATAEASATVTVNGDTMPYHAASIAVQNEPDRGKRAAIDAARLAQMAELNPLREHIFTRHHQLIGELGFAGYVDFYTTLKQIDLPALGQTMSAFLERTRDLYVEHITPWFEEVIGVPFAQAQRHDAALLLRMADRDAWFTTDRMVPALRQTLLGLGVALDDQPNVHLDAEDRPGKHPRAFCAPVRAPEEVYLVIRPSGGYQDYRALFHEAGHTEHFANVDAGRPFEERLLGDNSVTEAYAFTMEHLLLDRHFVGDLTGAGDEALLRFMHRAHVYYLYMLRRYAAKIVYELELHAQGPAGLAGMPVRYSDWMSRQLGFHYTGDPYLDDVDAGFYVAQYLRAWMLEAQLRERWRGRHGDRWWHPGGAGEEMRGLWSLGQALPAHLLTEELGMGALTIDALERRICEGLAVPTTA